MQGKVDAERRISGHVITSVECHVLLAPDYDPGFTSSAQDSFVVVIRTGEGAYGVGEADVNPWIAKACIEAPGTHHHGPVHQGSTDRPGPVRHRRPVAAPSISVRP